LNSYLIGEGLSGFVPSIAALIQGVGGNPECRNVSKVSADGNVTYVNELYTPGKGLFTQSDTF
jgi:riboflavin transporter 2